MADVKKMTEKTRSLSQQNVRKMGGCQSVRSRNEESSKRNQLFHTSLRHLQAKIEAENHQVQETIKPLLDAENGFLKLDCFLTQREVAELRRKELLHKRWTERVWFPVQRSMEEHVSSCRRRQSLYSHYLRHCNSKGFVFLETYDPLEYNPFLLNVKKPQCFKFKMAVLNDTSHLQLEENKKKRACSCEAEKHNEKYRSALRTINLCAVSRVCAREKSTEQNTSGRCRTAAVRFSVGLIKSPAPHRCNRKQLMEGGIGPATGSSHLNIINH